MTRRLLWRASTALALLAGLAVALSALQTTWPLHRLPLWDGAGNGWGGVELWAALRGGHPLEFLQRLNAQDKWPFGFSLLMLPFVAIGGASFASATLLPALAFAVIPALLIWLAREATGGDERDGRGLTAGVIAAALWLTSPLPRALATVAMRETPGAALALALTAAYLRARRLGTLCAWRLCGGLLLALFFTKYNYFLLIGAPLATHALFELDAEERRALSRRLIDSIFRRGWRSPPRTIALVAALSFVALLAGKNPGGLIYGTLIVASILCLLLRWRSIRLWRGRLTALDPAPRALLEMLLLPIWIWSLSPSPIHPRNLIAFLRNRPGDLPEFAPGSLVAPLRSFVVELVATEPLGLAVGAAAIAGALWALSRRGPRRMVALAALVGLLLVIAHPMKEARFLVTVAPFLFLTATLALSDLLAALRPRLLSQSALAASAAVAASAAAASVLGPESTVRLLIDHRQLTADAAFAAPLDEIAARLRGRPSAAFLGATNELSEALVRWRLFERERSETPFLSAPRGIDAATPPAERQQRFDAWLERERPACLVALEPLPGSRWWSDRDFMRYNAWQVEGLERLDAGRRWRPVEPELFPALGLEVTSRILGESATEPELAP